MDDLRSEIRAAFEREQQAHPPTGGLRADIVDAVSRNPRRSPNLQWLAVAAAVILGALVVLGLMSTRFHPRAVVPAATPNASPLADYGPPPAGVSLIYVQDLRHPGWLIGFDWTGMPRGTVKLAQPIDQFARLSQSPEGSGFAFAPPAAKGGFTQFLDRLGNPVPNQDSTLRYQDQMWADDSVHMCTLGYSGGLNSQWEIGLRLPGAAPSPLSVVALDSQNLQSGVIAVTFAACSARNDRAVIAYSYFERPTEFWVIRISDGTILSHRTYPADDLVNVTVSSDASLIAENSGKSTGQVAPAAASTVIRRATDMSVVSTLDPTIGVLGFNSDNSLALVTLSPWASGVVTDLAVIDVQNGKTIWRSKQNEEFAGFLAEPNGRDLAVMLQAPSDSSLHPSINLVMVRSTGTETDIPGRYGAT